MLITISTLWIYQQSWSKVKIINKCKNKSVEPCEVIQVLDHILNFKTITKWIKKLKINEFDMLQRHEKRDENMFRPYFCSTIGFEVLENSCFARPCKISFHLANQYPYCAKCHWNALLNNFAKRGMRRNDVNLHANQRKENNGQRNKNRV